MTASEVGKALTRKRALPKPLKVILWIAAGFAVLYLAYYIFATSVPMKYLNATDMIYGKSSESMNMDFEEFRSYLNENGYKINYPSFGNTMMHLGMDTGGIWINDVPFVDDLSKDKLYDAYMAIDDPLMMWANMLSYEYDARGKVDYTVERTGSELTVHFTGEVYNADGSVADNIDKEFIFDVGFASILNPPKWKNRTAEDDYFMNMEYAKK